MKHISFQMKGNRRLSLRNIESIELNPKSKLQLILGTNGSGKSSLLEELSPLASDHSNYNRGGYKSMLIEHKGSVYELLSDFTSPRNVYTFTKDNEVLFSGHTAKVFQNLVKEEFGITQDVHDVMIGTRRFSTMDTAARRAWFTKLSPTDYSYSIAYYKRLTEAQRDITGTIRRLNNKLMQEKAKLIDQDEESKYRTEITRLKLVKDEMLQSWSPLSSTVAECLAKITIVDNDIEDHTDKLTKSIRVFSNAEGFATVADVRLAQSNTKAVVLFLTRSIDEIYQTVENNRKTIRETLRTADVSAKSVDADMASLRKQLIDLRLTLLFTKSFPSLELASEAILECQASVGDMLNTIKPDQDDKYNSTGLADLTSKKVDTQNELQALEKEHDRQLTICETMEHRRIDNHTQCPKCDHIWSIGYDETAYNNAKLLGAELTESIRKTKDKLIDLTELTEEYTTELDYYRHIVSLASAHSKTLAPLWDVLFADKYFKRYPKHSQQLLASVSGEIKKLTLIDELTTKAESLKQLKIDIEETSGVDHQGLINRNHELELKLYTEQTSLASSREHLKRLEAIESAMEYQSTYEYSVGLLCEQRQDLIKAAEDANRRTVINKILMSLDSEILQLEKSINQIDIQKGIVKAVESEVEDCGNKEKLLKLAIKELSPSEGLIARGLTGFINHFIAQMNAVIKKVWLYPLEILPFKITEESGVDLDYKFSFLVNDTSVVPEISNGSGAQTEIFDLAFMLVSMKHLGLEDCPIFLDEFSIKMDYAHRREAMRMVMELITSSNFSQIFMVSHYESSYGTLANADITVMCPDNIELPPDLAYNQNTVIQH